MIKLQLQKSTITDSQFVNAWTFAIIIPGDN